MEALQDFCCSTELQFLYSNCFLIYFISHVFGFTIKDESFKITSLPQDFVKRQTRFVSRQPAKVIVSSIEAVAESMGLKVHTRNFKV